MFDKRRLIRVALQSTEGTPAVPADANAVLCETLETQPINLKTTEINKMTAYMGGGETIVVNDNSTFKASVSIATGGNGRVPIGGTVPPCSALLQAVGMQETSGNATSDTSQVGGNLNAIKLHVGASAVDDFYQGHAVVVTSARGAVANAETLRNKVTLALEASAADDYYVDDSITVNQFAGTLPVKTHTATEIMLLKADVGSVTLAGMDLTVTQGTVTQSRKIITWVSVDASTVKVKINQGFSFTPASTNVYAVSEERTITAYAGSTKVVTVGRGFKYAVSGTATYKIGLVRIITSYNGTTKIASVDRPFSAAPDLILFTIPEFVRYDEISDGFQSLTTDFHVDNVLHEYYDCKGTVSMAFKAGEVGMLNFDFTGLLNTYENMTLPAVTYSNNVKPLPINAENTTVIFHGYTGAVSDVSIDKGNTVTHRDLMGQENITITDFKPVGSITLEATTPNQKNFIDIIRAQSSGNLIIQHGIIGNMFVVSAPSVTLTDPTYSEQDGKTFWTFKLVLNAQGKGNNHFSFIYQ